MDDTAYDNRDVCTECLGEIVFLLTPAVPSAGRWFHAAEANDDHAVRVRWADNPFRWF
jgi:hypothetical protein